MPLVHIDLVEGRPPERLERLIAEVSTAVAESLDAPIETVRIVINELKPNQYGVGGKPWPVVVEERRRQADERASS